MEVEKIISSQAIQYQEKSGERASEKQADTAVAALPAKEMEKVAGTADLNHAEKKPEAADKSLQNILDEVNKKLKPSKTRAEFSYFEPTNSVSIKILDDETDEVIREVPSKDRLELSVKLMKMAGLILDEKG